MSSALARPIAQCLDHVPASWRGVVEPWRDSAAGQGLRRFIDDRQARGATIYPSDPLRALVLTELESVRVVILGQDPYHGPGQAEGLAFSVPMGQRIPPSLRNIFQEIGCDLGMPPAAHGHLDAWARRGVLLLNTVLTVENGQPGAHAQQGWEVLTDAVIKAAADDGPSKVFMLWGAAAQAKARLLGERSRHCVLQANHPSPLSARRPPRPFVGCAHFSAANRFLASRGEPEIDWSLDAARQPEPLKTRLSVL